MSKILTEAQISNIIEDHNNKMSNKDIGKKYNLHEASVRRLLRNRHVYNHTIHKISEEVKEQIVKEYLEGNSAEKISRTYNIDPGVVKRAVIKAGYQLRTLSESKRLFKINENFFNTIDSEEKAYWLGFIAADGCIRKNDSGSNEFSIGLAMKDYEHLMLFKQRLKSEHTISVNKNTNMCRLRIVRKSFTDDLIRHGIVQSKTMKPFHVPDKFETHWLRGLFDGDGSFWVRQRPGLKQQVAFSFSCATLEQVEQIRTIFTFNGISGGSVYKATCNGYHCSFEGNKKVASIASLIYTDKDMSPFLQRKFDIVKHTLQT